MALCPTSLCFSSLAVPSAMPQNVSLEVVNSRVSLPVFNISWPVIPSFGRLCISMICISSLLCGWIWFWEAFRFSFPRCQMPPVPQNFLIRKKKPSYSISPAEVGGSRWMRLAWGAVDAKNQGIKEEFAPPWLFGCYSVVPLLELCYWASLRNVVLWENLLVFFGGVYQKVDTKRFSVPPGQSLLGIAIATCPVSL